MHLRYAGAVRLKPPSTPTTEVNQNQPPIRLAISTCPNDTFAFHAILQNKIDLGGLDFEVELLDIQQLNDGLFAGRFDFAKASFHAAALLSDQAFVLPSGSALGFGVARCCWLPRKTLLPTSGQSTSWKPERQPRCLGWAKECGLVSSDLPDVQVWR